MERTKFNGIRFLNRLYAFFNRYYWARCPICNEYYGGHESGGTGIPSGHSVCSKINCINEARALWKNVEMYAFVTKDNSVAYVEFDKTTGRYLHELKL